MNLYRNMIFETWHILIFQRPFYLSPLSVFSHLFQAFTFSIYSEIIAKTLIANLTGPQPPSSIIISKSEPSPTISCTQTSQRKGALVR